MAKLTAAQRNALPDSTFAGPNRSYPIPDASHAVFAKAMAHRAWNKNDMTYREYKNIERQANAKLRGGR